MVMNTSILSKRYQDTDYNKQASCQLLDASKNHTRPLTEARIRTLTDAGADVNITDNEGKTPLFYAVQQRNNESVVQALIAAGADVNITDHEGETALSYAAYNGNKIVVRALIEASTDVNLTENEWRTALLDVIKDKDSGSLVFSLIDTGADVNITDNEGKTALFYAVQKSNNESVVRALIDAGADVNTTDDEEKTALFYAVQSDNENSVNILLNAGSNLNNTDVEGQAPLHYAVMANKGKIVHVLINAGADVNIANNRSGNTVLFYAVQNNNENVVQALIEAGADVNARNSRAQSPLFYAILNEDETVVPQLIDIGADPNLVDNKGRTVLFYAVTNHKESVAYSLLKIGVSVHVTDKNGKTPLSYAIEDMKDIEGTVNALIEAGSDTNVGVDENTPILIHVVQNDNGRLTRNLLKHGASINVIDNKGKTALFYAIQLRYNKSIAGALIAAGADVNMTDNEGKTALFYAVQQSNNESVVGALIDAGADVNIIDNEGKTAASLAVKFENLHLALKLIEAGVDVQNIRNITDKECKSLLILAVEYGRLSAAIRLIQGGADVDICDKKGKTALFYAVKYDEEIMVRALIAAGADVNITDNEGKTAFFYAVQKWTEQSVVRELIAAGTDVNTTYNKGKTALFCAVQQRNSESVAHALLDAGADVNITDNEGKTALFYAVQQSNNESVVGALIAAGADVNTTDNEEKTALFYAVQIWNNESDVRALIDAGADLNKTDNEGKTALFYALNQRNNYCVVRTLIDAGADVNRVDNKGKTAILFAFQYDYTFLFQKLIAAGADVNRTDNEGKTALFDAIQQSNNESMVRALIAAGADVNMTDNLGKTALIYGVQQSNNESVVGALIAAGTDVNRTYKEGKTALFYAVQQSNNENVVGALIAAGADVNRNDNEGKTPLFYAIQQSNNESMVRALIAACADVNMADNEGKTALFYAVQQRNNESVVGALIADSTDVKRTDKKGKTALFYAVQQRNNESVVRALIDAGADVHITDKEGKTALFYVKDHNSWDCTVVARTLIEYGGALVEARDHYGRTPLFYTLTQSLSLTQYLLEKGGDLHLKDNCSVLTYFINNNFFNLFENFMDLKLSETDKRLSFLMKERKVKKKSIFEAIVSVAFVRTLYIKPGFRNTNAKSLSELLRLACSYTANSWFERRNPGEVIETALKMIEEKDEDNELLIDSEKITAILPELFKLGANPNTEDSDGNTALHYATQLALHGVSQGKVMKICHQLKDFKVSFDIKNHRNETPLLLCLSRTVEKMSTHCCTWSQVKTQVAVCRFLIRHGSNIKAKTQGGKSVLHLVLELLREALLEQDGELRKEILGEVIRLIKGVFTVCDPLSAISKGYSGNTPLHLWATLKLASGCDHHHYSNIIAEEYTFQRLLKLILDLLRQKNAQLNGKNENGETPLHLCRTWTAVELLLDAGVNQNDVDSSGRSPLLVAAKINGTIKNLGTLFPDVSLAPDVFWKTVLQRGLNPWAEDKDGESVLSIIIQSKDRDLASAMVKVACEKVPDHLLVMFSLLTSICKDSLANSHWKKDVTKMILSSTKCPVNGNDYEDSPLHYCCRNIMKALICLSVNETKTTVHWSMVKLLRSFGADYRIPDAKGLTCLDIAEKCPALKILLLKPIDLDGHPVLISKWKPVSKANERYLAEVARHLESKQVESYWYHKDPLAKGSFGAVFAGINENDGREVAIKRIEKIRMQRPEDKREITNLTALGDCKHVVRYICFFEDKEFSYIVLELMEENLERYLHNAIQIDTKVKLCKDVVKGLQFLHKKNILHRDLKPKNILFKTHPNLCLKIADFGLSRCMDSIGSTSSVYGSNVGTRCWIAPEVLNSTKKHSKSSDVFACGLVLHYILSVKKHPFAPADCAKKGLMKVNYETETNILHGHMEGWDDSLCPEGAHLIKQMLDSENSKRPSADKALDHPFFWRNKKKTDFLIAVGNQPEIECSRAKRTPPLTAFETDLESKFGTIVKYVDWHDPGYVQMPAIYTEMTKRRPYDTKSVVELVRFIRNTYAHISEDKRPTQIRKQVLEDFVFLEYFPSLVMEVYKAVTTHGWDQTREEIKYAMKK